MRGLFIDISIVAIYALENVYIHDRGSEFCNKVVRKLNENFGVEIRVIRAGRPMANGQAESAVKNVKQKMQMLCLENGRNYIMLRNKFDCVSLSLFSFLYFLKFSHIERKLLIIR